MRSAWGCARLGMRSSRLSSDDEAVLRMRLSRANVRACVLQALSALVLLAAPLTFAEAPTRMPAFDLAALGGGRISDESLAGKVTLIDFWASWCAACLEEIRHWNELHVRYGQDDFQVLGLALQSGSSDDIKPFAEKFKIRYPVALGNEDVERRFGIRGFPAAFLIDREGRMRKKYLGQYSSKYAQIERDVQQLLLEKRAAEVTAQ